MSRTNRRSFLKQTAAATALAGLDIMSHAAEQASPKAAATSALPWYRRSLRWAQTNITEIDPAGYDINWWRQHWKRTRVQGGMALLNVTHSHLTGKDVCRMGSH